MPIVRTTMRPDQPIEVDDIEALDLQRQGLLVDDSTTPAPQTAAPAAPSTPKKAAAGGTSKES
jgi:hypothetical protein